MDFELTSSGRLKHCPSVIDIIDESLDSYIIGCYQLVGEGEDVGLSDEQLTSINQRLGCLVYIDSSVIKSEFDCLDGGVFDLKVVQSSGQGQVKDDRKCWAAHSNGTIASYLLINETIVLNQRIVSGSSMLCSLAVCDPVNDLLIIGDSNSKVIAVQSDKAIADCKVTNSSDDPVWCLKSVQLNTSTFIILSGSEDSRLRVNLLQSGSFSTTIKTVKDFTAGVTSIAIIDNPDRQDDDDHSQSLDYIVYVGSYDETIRIYRLIISIGQEQEQLITQESIKLLPIQSINVKDSGIWKLIPIKSEVKWPYLLTASMYAGAHILQQQSILTAIEINTSLCMKTPENQGDQSGHLVYGVSGTINCNQIIVTSFYDKSFHSYRRCF